MTDLDRALAALDRLDVVIGAATPGPWSLHEYGDEVEITTNGVMYLHVNRAVSRGSELPADDATFIATFDPSFMRVVVAGWRDVLTDHQYLRADALGKPRYECVRDMEWWPCPDVARVFDGLKAAGVWDE